MTKKLKRSDWCFAALLFIGLLFLSIFIFVFQDYGDETFYATIPFRLIDGDSLIQHEWHATQLSSIFTYLPVRFWLSLTGSADGLIVFLRSVYLLIHTVVAVAVYVFFRKYGSWSIATALLFFLHVPYRKLAISYVSVFVIALLLLSFCLICICKKPSVRSYILAGICYGACCICNPSLCITFIVYFVICVVRNISKKRNSDFQEKDCSATNCSELKTCANLFSIKAFAFLSCGVLIIAVIFMGFFLATGGTIDSILRNIGNLIESSEYEVFSTSIIFKIVEAVSWYNQINFNLPFLLPLLYIVMFFDKKRKSKSHIYLYLVFTLILGIICMCGMLKLGEFLAAFISLPFAMFSITCYILTEKKNKLLFYAMWVPCAIAAVFQFVAANTLLWALGVVFAVNNVAGTFFVRDLFNEIVQKSSESKKQKHIAFSHILICLIFCVQFAMHGIIQLYDQNLGSDAVKVVVGPYSGLYMTEAQHNDYMNLINDIDLIKEKTDENEPLLIVSYYNWTYLYAERPFAIHTTWDKGELQKDELIAYYKENPDKVPEYIYVDTLRINGVKGRKRIEKNIEIIEELFDCTQEELPNGIFLTVENYKYSQ